jgi:hypothetical protein
VSQLLSNLTGEPGERFQNLRFVETDYLAPTFQKVEESGTTVVYLERPSWERFITEVELQRMLDG